MNICIIGLGSIGQRHLKNIHAVAAKRGIQVTVDVVEPREIGYFFDFALAGAKNVNSIPYANGIIGFVEG